MRREKQKSLSELYDSFKEFKDIYKMWFELIKNNYSTEISIEVLKMFLERERIEKLEEKIKEKK